MTPGKIRSRTEVKSQERNLPFATTSYSVARARGMGPRPSPALEIVYRDQDLGDLNGRCQPGSHVSSPNFQEFVD